MGTVDIKITYKLANINKLRKYINLKHLIAYNRRQVLFRIFIYIDWEDDDYLISVLSIKFYTSTSIQGEDQAMEIEVSIW